MSTKSKKKVTISDIARIAGVAKSTVSEVIHGNPKGKVKAETVESISKIIHQYNYIPSSTAQALTTKRTRQIGYLVSSTATLGIANNYYAEILAGIEYSCSMYGFKCLVGRYDFSPHVADFILNASIRQRSMDALIIAGRVNEKCQEFLETLEFPVAIMYTETNERLFGFNYDETESFVNSFKHLAGLNHRNILLPYFCDDEQKKITASLKKCKDSEVNISGCMAIQPENINDFDFGILLAERVFGQNADLKVTAMVANDQLCCGFLQKMDELGKKCPDDFSIVSTCDTALCKWSLRPLDSFALDAFANGQTVAANVIEHLEGKLTAEELKAVLLKEYSPLPIVARGSCARLD